MCHWYMLSHKIILNFLSSFPLANRLFIGFWVSEIPAHLLTLMTCTQLAEEIPKSIKSLFERKAKKEIVLGMQAILELVRNTLGIFFKSCLIQLLFSWAELELVTELNNFQSMSEYIFYVKLMYLQTLRSADWCWNSSRQKRKNFK